MLFGFQSQNYFLILFSVLAIWGLGFRTPGSWQWAVGLISLALACLSMATGFLAAVAAGGAVMMRLLADRRRPGIGETITLLACLVAAVIGWATRTEVPAHAILRVESLSAFVVASLRFAAWPTYQFPLCGLLAVAPIIAVAFNAWRRRRDGLPAAGGLLALGFWVLMQTAAMAYGRGGHSVPPACRYMDLLALGPLVNLLAWAALADGARNVRCKMATLAFASAWTAWLVAGLWAETDKDFRGWLPFYQDRLQLAEQNLQGYLATGDFQQFLAGKPPEALPYPKADRLAVLLDTALRSVLPADLRRPLDPRSVETDGAFLPGVHPRINGRAPQTPYWNSDTAGDGSAQGTMRVAFVSETTLPYLRFSFAGDLGAEGLRFSPGGAASDWRPARRIGERWHVDYLRKPDREFTVTAVDANPTQWFAFGAPVEVGFWSYWAGFALRRGIWIFWAGISLVCVGELAGVFWQRQNRT